MHMHPKIRICRCLSGLTGRGLRLSPISISRCAIIGIFFQKIAIRYRPRIPLVVIGWGIVENCNHRIFVRDAVQNGPALASHGHGRASMR